MAEINEMFRHNKQALAKYNLQDCKLVTRIFEQTHLLDFAIERSRLTGLNLIRWAVLWPLYQPLSSSIASRWLYRP